MLIIFDLDDTLIDTSGCITPFQLEKCLSRMIEAGLIVGPFEEALECFKRLDETAESAKSALLEFLEINGGGKEFFTIGIKEIYENISLEYPLFSLDGVEEVLIQLKSMHRLALVTMGKRDLQLEKLKKAGIDSSLFSKIVVVEEGSKKPHYQEVVEELAFSSDDVVVCGDRIMTDLKPAKELGFRTIQMRWGRGLHASGAKNDVDFTISRFPEIKEIIASL